MKTISSEIDRLFADPKREVSTFRPPPQVRLAQDLGVPPVTFRIWFTDFQARTGAHDWYALREGVYIAFLDWLRLEGLIDG